MEKQVPIEKMKLNIVYSKNRKDIISRTEWLYRKDWKEYEAAATDSKDLLIDSRQWVSASLDDHIDLAVLMWKTFKSKPAQLDG